MYDWNFEKRIDAKRGSTRPCLFRLLVKGEERRGEVFGPGFLIRSSQICWIETCRVSDYVSENNHDRFSASLLIESHVLIYVDDGQVRISAAS